MMPFGRTQSGGILVDLFRLRVVERHSLVSDIDPGSLEFRRDLLFKAASVAVNEAPSANAQGLNFAEHYAAERRQSSQSHSFP